VHAFERDAVRVALDSEARVSLPALPGETFSGRVISVGRQVDPASRTVPIRIDLPNPAGRLRPGMSAKAVIGVDASAAKVVVVPAAAMQRLQDKWVVFIPRATGTFEIREVGRGRDLEGEVEVLSGLQGDETIVVEGAFLLKAEAEKARGEGAHHEHD
jgi:cobalt-zinc-cadmium efflux system membrane fusion protein